MRQYFAILFILSGEVLACPPPILINQTKIEISPIVIKAATNTCRLHYKKCLKKLIKRPGDQNYWAICGGKLK